MADGVTFTTTVATAPSGTIVASDDCGAAGQAQIVKLGISTDGSATAIPADATNGLDVDVTRLPALVAGTANIGDVDVLTINGVSPAFGTGVRSASVQRVTIATDDAVPVTDNAGSLTVDNAVLSVVGGGVEATAQRVTIASDSTGVLSVDDNGGSLTVDGTVTANLAAGTNNIGDIDVLTVNGVAPAFNTGVRGATVQRVTIATDDVVPASQSGTWTVQPGNTANTTAWKVDGSAVTQPVSLATNQPVGTVAHDAADSGNPVKVGAKAETSPKGVTLVADGDRTDLYADADGLLMVKINTSFADVLSERVTDTSGTSTAFTNFSAVASTKNYVTAITVYNSSATAGTVDFRDGTAGSVLWTMPIPAGGGSVLPAGATPYFKTSANTALAYDVSGALTTVTISVSGFQSKV